MTQHAFQPAEVRRRIEQTLRIREQKMSEFLRSAGLEGGLLPGFLRDESLKINARDITLDELLKAAVYLGKSLDWLLGRMGAVPEMRLEPKPMQAYVDRARAAREPMDSDAWAG